MDMVVNETKIRKTENVRRARKIGVGIVKLMKSDNWHLPTSFGRLGSLNRTYVIVKPKNKETLASPGRFGM